MVKRISLFLSVFILSWIFLSIYCAKKNTTEPENKAVTLEEIDDVLPNPFKGFAPWIGENNQVFQTKLQEKTFTWKQLEPTQGNYDWNYFERLWGNIAQTEKRVGFRITAALPGEVGHVDVPDWLVQMGIKLRPYEIDNQYGMAPDWDDPNLLQAHHDLLMALGQRYNDDPRIAWVDIGSYGFWGEWHVYLNDSLAAADASKQVIIDDYLEAFPNKMKVIPFDDDFGTEYATNHGCGIRNDCLGTEASNDWYLESLNRIDPTLNDRVWKTAMITGEFCGSDYGAVEGTTVRFDLNYQFIQQTHWSFIGPAGGTIQPQNEQHRQNLEKLLKKLGYRFVLKKVEHASSVNAGDELDISITVANKGVAPFYFDWPLVCYLIDASDGVAFQQALGIDIRDWLPGEQINTSKLSIPSNLFHADYEVKLAITDPNTNQPGVMFANTNRDSLGRYLVGRLSVR
jgi:hypothetical protein